MRRKVMRGKEVNYPCAVKHYSRNCAIYIKDFSPKDLFSEDCLETYKILLLGVLFHLPAVRQF